MGSGVLHNRGARSRPCSEECGYNNGTDYRGTAPCQCGDCNSKFEAIMLSPGFVRVFIVLFGLVDIAMAQSCAAE
jgi:hypothetical protein